MLGIMNKKKQSVSGRTVYLEIYGDNRVTYRVVEGYINGSGGSIAVYGVEAEDGARGELEAITDYSRSLTDAVGFAETLIRSRARPKEIYSRALNSLYASL